MRKRLVAKLVASLSLIIVAPTLAATLLLLGQLGKEQEERDKAGLEFAARYVERTIRAESDRFLAATVEFADLQSLRDFAAGLLSGGDPSRPIGMEAIERELAARGFRHLAIYGPASVPLWDNVDLDLPWWGGAPSGGDSGPELAVYGNEFVFHAAVTARDYGDKTPLFRFRIDAIVPRAFIDSAKAITGYDVTVLGERGGEPFRLATTLTDAYGFNRVGTRAPLPDAPEEGIGISIEGGGVFARFRLEGYVVEIVGRRSDLGPVSLYVSALGFAVLTLSLVATFAVARLVIKPVRDLMRTVERIARAVRAGERVEPVEAAAGDEFRSLAGAFGSMAAMVSGAIAETAELRDYMRSVIDSTPSPLLTLRADMSVVTANRAATELLGGGDLSAKHAADLSPALARFATAVSEACLELKPREFYRESLLDDRTVVYNVSIYPFRAGAEVQAVLRLDDVTELEKKDAQLRQMQNLDLLGTLAGGIAHDFNNILGGIVGAASLVRMDIQANRDDLIAEHVGLIEDSSARARGVIRQLLSLSRKHETVFEPFDLVESSKRVAKLARAGFDASIALRESYEEEKASALGDANQVEQAILNLLVNGKDAMTVMRAPNEPQGGSLELRVARVRADSAFVELHPDAKPGDYWLVAVSDTGVGMSSKTAAKIFEPFFTMKPKGIGTGLGLAMVFSIAKNHGGFIDVYSELGQGTTMKVFLPVSSQDAAREEPRKEPIPGSGSILVAEDDPALRRVAAEILQAAGYSVTEAGDGEAALKRVSERGFDLVLTDLVMPKLNGLELIRRIDGKIPSILMSGYRFDERLSSARELGCSGYLEKPFTARKLTEAVSDALAGKRNVGDRMPD
jgi:signal transduction histidine kinase/ActR/RegA family two-component response regulator